MNRSTRTLRRLAATCAVLGAGIAAPAQAQDYGAMIQYQMNQMNQMLNQGQQQVNQMVQQRMQDPAVRNAYQQYLQQMQASGRQQPILRLRAHGDAARAEALAKAQQQLAAGASPQQALEFLAHTLTNRLLHAPTVALREAALSGDGELPRAAEKLFPHGTGDTDA